MHRRADRRSHPIWNVRCHSDASFAHEMDQHRDKYRMNTGRQHTGIAYSDQNSNNDEALNLRSAENLFYLDGIVGSQLYQEKSACPKIVATFQQAERIGTSISAQLFIHDTSLIPFVLFIYTSFDMSYTMACCTFLHDEQHPVSKEVSTTVLI